MIEDLLKDLTAAILTLNETIKQQARVSVVGNEMRTMWINPQPEAASKPDTTTPDTTVKTTSTEPTATSEPAPEPDAPTTSTTDTTVEERHKALQQLCLKLVREDPTRKARIKSIMGEYGATLVADIKEEHLSEAERRIQDLG